MIGRDDKVSSGKITAVQYLILAMFLLLAWGLWRLQVLGSQQWELAAERNRIRTVPILAPRGKILDREGRVIVDNYPSFSALLLRDQARNLGADVERIANGLDMTPAEVREHLRRAGNQPQILLKDDITPDELAFVESHKNELPELETVVVHRRLYPRNGFLAHLIGYVGEVSEEMLDNPKYEFFQPGDVVGKSGVEQYYNDILMGQNGYRRVVVNSRGKELGQLADQPATPGKPLKLTIDLDLQIAAEEALEGKNGAIVALDPRSGEVLAMASRPSFDPNDFAVRISPQEWAQLVNDPGKPMLNKAIQAQLAPGSTFKIVMATAGLQEGIAQDMVVNCPGGKTFYGHFYKCHAVHGNVEIHRAIVQSCDSFFYTLAERLGIERIARYATALGLGQKTGIDLPNEASGVIPSEEWKIRNFKQKWYAGETISVGIGQGAVTVTPIQLAHTVGGIASDGVLRRPHVAFPDGLPPHYKEALAGYPEEVRVSIDPTNWEIITDAMADVTNPGGTAAASHLEGIDFAGKTGSAQTMSNELARKLGHAHSVGDTGWFVGMTPRRDPEIVVAAMVEEGEHGTVAAHLAAQVIKAYVEKQRRRQLKVARGPQHPPAFEMTGVWSVSGEDGRETFQAGRFRLPLGLHHLPLALAAPGLDALKQETSH
ncbi:MAG TPA: penicillin-binding protein 2 [Terriglobales bacterium]|nr:penicillin-binding protein 2 [Terriglobales bacterium]